LFSQETQVSWAKNGVYNAGPGNFAWNC